jgi:hypothetical protein
MSEIVKDGDEILIKRVYGDWTTPNMGSWKDKISNSPIRVFQQFRNGPNATDNTIIMDAIELAIQNKDINGFCIVSTDSDYYSLALRLRENGKYVLGIGKKESKTIWQNSCNEFVKIENIMKGKELLAENNNKIDEETDIIKTLDYDGSNKILVTIFEYGLNNSRINADGWISLADFGLTIRTKHPSFDTRTFGSMKLLPLIKKFTKDYIDIKSNDCFPPNYYLRKKMDFHIRILVYLYLRGKVNGNNVDDHKDKSDENDIFFKNQYDGMSIFIRFLSNPIEYCSKYKCTVYQEIIDKNNLYKLINNIDDKRYMQITINIEKKISNYLVISRKEEINEIINNLKIVQLENFYKIISGKENFFENEIKKLDKLISEHNKEVDDFMDKIL